MDKGTWWAVSPSSPKESDITERLTLFFLVQYKIKHFKKKKKSTESRRNIGIKQEKESEVAQSCLTLCDPVDYSLSGFSVYGVFQARVLEWVAIPFSRGSSQPRD